MSKFFSARYAKLEPYTPGEQPRDKKYVKLNTNESPYPPSAGVLEAVTNEINNLNLYSDPTSKELTKKIASHYGVEEENVIMTNGSDEVINFAFMAFCDDERKIAFPDITYGFYPVFADVNHIEYKEIPLCNDFTINPGDYFNLGMNIIIANPNAPTGIALTLSQIEEIVKSNKDNVVIIDEAYVDFGAQSAVELTKKYNNLLVTQTYSKSRSLAGARLGFGIGNSELIQDLNTIKFSVNPYNVNRMTSAAGIAAIDDNDYYMHNCRKVIANREYTVNELTSLGFEVLKSSSNFIFARHNKISGVEYYKKLKENGVLVRHFSKPRIDDFVRITIGTKEQTNILIEKTKIILGAD